MITKQKIKLCAENITKSVNIKDDGEFVVIRGGFHCHELLEEIALSVLRKGGIPHIISTSDYFEENLWQDDKIKAKTLEKPPFPYIEMIKNIDAYIVIEYPEDPSIRNEAPENKLDAYQESIAPLRDILYGFKEEYAPGKKWCYAAWPSKKAAEFYNVDYEVYEKFIVDGMSIPSEDLTKITTNLGKFFIDAKKVYVSDDFGTDFWVSIENRARILDDGLLSDEQIALGNLGGNLPAGEVFFPPNEKQGEGKNTSPAGKLPPKSPKATCSSESKPSSRILARFSIETQKSVPKSSVTYIFLALSKNLPIFLVIVVNSSDGILIPSTMNFSNKS